MKKWGIYLRAPDAFLEAVEKRLSRLKKLSTLVEIRFGTLTGWNGFYCPTPRSAAYELFAKVDPRYKVPLVRTIKDVDRFVATSTHCEGELFVCDEPKAKLKGAGTRAYIAWAEKQRNTDGVLRYKTGEMAGREPWYSTRDPVKGNVIFPMFIGRQHFAISNPKRFAITNNLLAGTVRKVAHRKIVAAVTNSSWFALSCELYGRVNLGEGALKIEKIDLDEILVPDFDLFSANDIALLDATFKGMASRNPLPIEEEVSQPDRAVIDAIICRALELPEGADGEIRTAVVELCNEREFVSDMRRDRASDRVQRDVREVMEEIIAQVMPLQGIKRFPEDFALIGAKSEKLLVPSGDLEIVSAPRVTNQTDIFAGLPVYRVRAAAGYKAEFNDAETVEFIYLAQNGKERTVTAPLASGDKMRMISEYKVYVQTFEATLGHAVRQRVLDGRLVRGIVRDVIAQSGLIIEELNLSPRQKRSGSAERKLTA
jgi:hypothetical protein